MRKFSLFIIFTILLAVSCGKKNTTVIEETGKLFNDTGYIRIGTMPTIDCLPFYIAHDRGWFKNEGLKVSFHPFTAHMDIDTALIGGSVDGAFTDIIRTERLQDKGKAKFVYLTSTELKWYLVTNKAARLNRLEQFGDKIVATTRFSATDYLQDKTFANVKTTAMVYRAQINDVNVRLGMLLNNEMDAEWLPEPHATAALEEGHKFVVVPKKDDIKFGVLAFRLKYATKNAQKLDKLLKIYSRACDSINKNGLQYYSAEIIKYCKTDTAVINHLPKMVFIHPEKPGTQILQTVHGYLH